MTPEVVLAGLVPFLLGLPCAIALSRRWVMGAVAAPLVGALVLTVAGVGGVATSTDPRWWVGAVGLAALVGPLPSLRAMRRSSPPLWRDVAPVVAGAIVVALPFLLLRRPPTDWDAHSIWMFHGEWFATGGRPGHEAFANLANYFSHPEYPPLVPSTGGLASELATGGHEWRAAQVAATSVGLSTALLLFLGTVEAVGRRTLGVLAGVVAGLALAAESTVGIANAEADHIAASSFAAAAVLLLGGRGRHLHHLGVLAASVAVLTKGEVMFATFGLLVVVALVRRRDFARRPLVVPAVLGVGWLVIVTRVLGAVSSHTTEGRLAPSRFVREETWSRGWEALGEMANQVAPLLGLTVIALTGALLVGRIRSEEARVARWLILVAAAPFAVVLVTYAVGAIEIEIWLASSVTRTTLATNGVLASAVAIAAAGALRSADPGTPGSASGEGRVPISGRRKKDPVGDRDSGSGA